MSTTLYQYDIPKASEKIRAWEETSGWRGQDVARRAGISHAHYSEIRNGNKRGSVATLTKIVRAFGKSLNDLIEVEATEIPDNLAREMRILMPIVDYWQEHLSEDELELLEHLLSSPKSLQLFVRLAKELVLGGEAFHNGLTSLLDLSEAQRT